VTSIGYHGTDCAYDVVQLAPNDNSTWRHSMTQTSHPPVRWGEYTGMSVWPRSYVNR